jgi:ABC-type branched-subunit amino acid transport system ATPase component
MAAAMSYLSINNIEVIYDHVILVLKGVSLQVPQGKIVALLGANGAGKSTTLKSISNLLRAERGDVTKGSVEFKGERIDQKTPAELVKKGVIQVMEGRHCFGHLSIEENLLTGAYTRSQSRAELKDSLDKVYNYFPRLKTRRTSQAGYTSGGEQQMCAIGRALMAKPEMILLDEPSMGLAPQIWPGTRPRRATFFLASPRKKAKKATRLHRSAFGRLPCAAHNGRPAQNSPFGLRQLRRTSPPVAALLGGSDGLSRTPSLY